MSNDPQAFPASMIFATIVLIASVIGFTYGLSQLGQYNTMIGQLAVAFSADAAGQKVGLQALVGISAVAGVISLVGLVVYFARKNQ